MPKTSRSAEEVAQVREHILSAAIGIIADKGFSRLSMRSLASAIGMTAANIYNYYSSKDELYLDIQTAGFQELYARFAGARDREKTPLKKIAAIMKEYISYGTSNPDSYNIIFSMDTPKYADYRDTQIEPVAYAEKKAGLDLIEITRPVVAELLKKRGKPAAGAWKKTVQAWIMLHGIVSLMNSRVLQEVADDSSRFIDESVKDVVNYLLS
ncbi:MAG TPA: TetR/AcrR family transcriptional regulator [Spirochaetota bacterium]|nr:TetR/AcrR family transcriptional regulator [Spirochaetota bacterium]HPV40052.1 TetR/AcrR family transcriptional regulator [Spirochaetota bacterium]